MIWVRVTQGRTVINHLSKGSQWFGAAPLLSKQSCEASFTLQKVHRAMSMPVHTVDHNRAEVVRVKVAGFLYQKNELTPKNLNRREKWKYTNEKRG